MPGISLDAFADRVDEAMHVISKSFMRKQSPEFIKIKMSIPQLVILNFIGKQGEVKMTDLAHHMNVTTAAMTGTIDKLVRQGYVMRVPDRKDRRIIKVRPTKKGADLVERVVAHRRKMIMEMFGKITQKEREDYLDILDHIREHMN